MRIEKVVIENINSLFGKFEIDFTDSAYDEGLFAIVGPSGAGKSTVLDAMCLALYGRTPRITVSAEHDDAMNRNCDGCRAEATFVSGGKRYKGLYEHRRTLRSAKPFMPPKNELYEVLSDGTKKALSDNSTQAKQKIIEIIGLDYDQFTRSVMLAQFKFAEFLSANSGQRAEILEQVSGTDIYRRISVAVYNKQKQYKTQLEEIRIRKETINVLEPEQLANIKDELKQIDGSIAWLDAVKTKTDESVAAILDKKQSEKSLKEFAEKKQRIARMLEEKAKELEQAQAEEKKQKQNTAELAQKLRTVRELDIKTAAAKKEEDRLMREIALAEDDILRQKKIILAILKKHLPEADDMQLRQLYEADNEAQIIREHISADLKQAEKNEAGLKEQRRKLLEGREEKEWADRLERLEAALPLLKAKAEIKAAKAELDELRKRLGKLKTDAKTLEGMAKENDEKFLYAKLQEKFADQRKQLVDGEPCPLCGALEHPGAGEQIDVSFLKAAEEEKRELDRQKEKHRNDLSEVEFAISTKTRIVSENEEALTGREALLEGFENTETDDIKKQAEQIKQIVSLSRKQSEEISAAAENVLHLTKQLSEVDKDAEQIRNSKDNIAGITKRKEESEMSLKSAGKERVILVSRRRELFGDMDADEQEAKQAKELEKAEENTAVIRKLAEAAKTDKAGNDADMETAKKRIAEMEKKLEKAYGEVKEKAAKTQLLKAAGQADYFDETIALLESLDEDPEKSEQELSKLSGSLGEVSTKLKERRGEARKVLDINEEKKKQITGFAAQEKQFGEEYKKWSDLSSLIGSADGIKFSRIAQGITFDVLLRFANESLKKMSDRYILIRDDKNQSSPLEISVIDNYQAGETRPVSNLSGGESFIVSLALALGLSEMSSGRTQIDSLFIDEGFASLDENYLELALQTLSTLGNRQNKLIGVISHVKELKERIDTQIEVSPQSGGRSTMTGPGVAAV